jgi:GNAT superfamily N-acetyltransferase
MTIAEIRALFDDERHLVEYPGLRREAFPDLVRHVDLQGTWSLVLWSHLTPETADAAIAAQIAYFRGMGHSFEWKLYDYDPPPDLGARLAAHRLVPEEPETMVVLDTAEAPPALLAPVTADIRPITDEVGLRALIQLEETVWKEDRGWLETSLRDEMALTPDDLRLYMAYVDGVPASVAWIRFHPGQQFAGLWGGSTLPAYRGRGLYTALVAVRLRDAQAQGVRFLTVDASPMSRPILERLGFRVIAVTTPYAWEGSGDA